MSIATLYNVSTGLRPGPRLFIAKDSDGVWTGRLTFTCQKFQLINNLSSLEKGVALSTLYPEAGDYGFLTLLDWDSEDQPGGISEVTVNFRGLNYDGDNDSSWDQETNVTYTRNDAIREESIFKHPKYIAETTPDGKIGIKALYDKVAYLDGDTFIVKAIGSRKTITIMSEQDAEWYNTIIIEGFDTFLKPTSEWTKSATARGTIPARILGNMGKVDDNVPGSPKAPGNDEWILSGATESIPVVGDGVNNYSLTWTSGYYPAKIFKD